MTQPPSATPAEAPRCSRCGGERDTAGRYCRACRAWYMRAWRKLQAEMRKRVDAELLGTAYGKIVSRETIEWLEKRCKGNE